MNPIILGVINGAGILLTNFEKIEMTKIAFTTYEKVFVELRSALRGDEFNKDLFIDKMKVIDEMIIDQTPFADKFTKRNMIKNINNYFFKKIKSYKNIKNLYKFCIKFNFLFF